MCSVQYPSQSSEIATAYFKNGDRMKGGVFSKGAKAIRDCEIPITTKKEALALKGVGKGIAGTSATHEICITFRIL